MTAVIENFKSFLCSSWKEPRILWCAVFLFWGSSSACEPTADFETFSFMQQAEARLEIQRESEQMSALFLGQVNSIKPVRGLLERGLQVYRLRFKVERSWIGTAKPGAFVTLKILEPDSTCDFFPEVKGFWVVWVKLRTLELNYRSTPVNAKRWTNASLPAVLEALVTQSEP